MSANKDKIKYEQTPCAKERRIREAKFMKIDDFLRDCPYDNVRKLFELL